ncbi:SURF1 family cytochrome oxidase biogenesis protein [Nocardioides sp.]|uniref:SURF1 family cytochrome oxidase biogenesis protein n=1 Tax=Nocardioides sp. TaxID=35761 RepID=UPI003D0C0B97
MRSLSFLLTRRWLLFALTVVLLTALAWRLGLWQFHRLEDRKATNAIVERNVSAEPVPAADVLEVGAPAGAGEEWKRVTAVGEYNPADTVVVRYQTREGEAGVDVVVPLRTAEGPVLLVDRGWMAASNRAADVADVPPPPAGRVTVTGWVRLDGSGSSTRVSDQSVRSISSTAIGDALDLEVYGGFIDLDTEDPAPADALEKAELPDLSNGPHFFYGLQWWFFGVLAVFGFFYLLYDEWRGPGRTTGRTQRWLQGAEHPAVDREHDAVDKA